MNTANRKLKCYIVAGPNGAGKTTFAQSFLPNEGNCINFVNADLIAAGLSPFNPESAAFEAGKLLLKKLDSLAEKEECFAFETTLSGVNYVHRIKHWQDNGYEVVLLFLKLPNEKIAIQRVKLRVFEGGHNIPTETIKRRFIRGWENFNTIYKDIVDTWVVFDNSTEQPILIEQSK